MDRYTLLFLALRQLLPKSFHITFGSVIENPAKYPNAVGVSFKGGTPSHRVLSSGRYAVRGTRVVMNIVTAPSTVVKGAVTETAHEALAKGYSMVQSFLDNLELLNNYTYSDSKTGESVTILLAETLGDINQFGFNNNGQPVFSIHFSLSYV